jgi:hypothetical protein
MNIEYFKNYESIQETKNYLKKRKIKIKTIKYIYVFSFLSLLISLVIMCFSESEFDIKSIFCFIALLSTLILLFLFKNVSVNNVFYSFNDFPYQNPNSYKERPYSYVECHFKRGSLNESFTLQNKFLSDQDAMAYLINKVEIEFDECCLDRSKKEIIGYILKHRTSWNMPTDCDIEVKFKIWNTRPLKIFS